MLLSELLADFSKDAASVQDKKDIHGIVVDQYQVDTVHGVEELGFVIAFNDDKTYLSDDLLDVILDYQRTDIRVLLEVPFDVGTKVELIHYCANTTMADVSLMPPTSGDASDIAVYTTQLCEFTRLWIENNQCNYTLYPSAGYWDYLVSCALGSAPTQISDDPYMVEHFVDTLSLSDMDNIKAELEKVFVDCLPEGVSLEAYVATLAASVADRVEAAATEIGQAVRESADQNSDDK